MFLALYSVEDLLERSEIAERVMGRVKRVVEVELILELEVRVLNMPENIVHLSGIRPRYNFGVGHQRRFQPRKACLSSLSPAEFHRGGRHDPNQAFRDCCTSRRITLLYLATPDLPSSKNLGDTLTEGGG